MKLAVYFRWIFVVTGALLFPPYLPVYRRPGDAHLSEDISTREVTFLHPIVAISFAISACHVSIPKRCKLGNLGLTSDFPCRDVLDHWTLPFFYLAHVRISREIDIQELNALFHLSIFIGIKKKMRFCVIYIQEISSKLLNFWMNKQAFCTPGNYYF